MSVFRFKQFTIYQRAVAMKVNTDGVLIGAWVSLPQTNAPKVLDIGTGSGVIALMLAQRLCDSALSPHFKVDALEPHDLSAQAACKNVAHSPWASSIRVNQSTLQEYLNQPQPPKYDLIVSNPPFFEDSLRPPERERRFVRHTDSLSHAELVEGAAALLHDSGCFGVIVPVLQKEKFVKAAANVGLELRRVTILYSLPNKPPKRALMEFVHRKEPLKSDSLMIHDIDSKSFSAEYKKLTKDFYLAF